MSLSLRAHHRNPVVLGRIIGTLSDQHLVSVWIDQDNGTVIERGNRVLIIPISPAIANGLSAMFRSLRKVRDRWTATTSSK